MTGLENVDALRESAGEALGFVVRRGLVPPS